MTIQQQSTPHRPAARAVGTGRWPATAVFFLNGLTLSTYIVRLPSLKNEHHLSDGRLGVVGALFALSALAAMQGAGPLAARIGSRAVLRISLVVMPLLLAAVGLVGDPFGFALGAMALGAVHGTTDTAMNTHAVVVEQLSGRRVLNGCHAAWSISAVIASLTAAALAHGGVPPGAHFAGAAAVLLAGGLVVGPLLGASPAESHADRPAPGTGARTSFGLRGGWTRAAVALGVTGMLLMVCEGGPQLGGRSSCTTAGAPHSASPRPRSPPTPPGRPAADWPVTT